MVLTGILDHHLVQHVPLSDGESAQHLGGPVVLEAIQAAAQDFAIECDDRGILDQRHRVGGKMWGDRLHFQPVQGVADRTVGGRPPPVAAERLVQPRLMGTDESGGTTVLRSSPPEYRTATGGGDRTASLAHDGDPESAAGFVLTGTTIHSLGKPKPFTQNHKN
jgi:hypothetical protein